MRSAEIFASGAAESKFRIHRNHRVHVRKSFHLRFVFFLTSHLLVRRCVLGPFVAAVAVVVAFLELQHR